MSRTYSVGAVVNLAECFYPDTEAGEDFIKSIELSAQEICVYNPDVPLDRLDDAIHEAADSIVPVYNHQRMVVLTDVGAYREDISDFGDFEDVIQAAGVALYLLARRGIEAVLRDLDNSDEDED